MESSAKALGHPIHQVLIVFPLGLLATAVVFDVLRLITDADGFSVASYYMIAAGVLSGLLAAVFGLIDYLAIPAGTRARRVGALHGVGNVVVLLLFAASAWFRWPAPTAPSVVALGLSFCGMLLALVTGWLGGELVERLGIGVDPGANPNAPSSLSGRPASAGGPTTAGSTHGTLSHSAATTTRATWASAPCASSTRTASVRGRASARTATATWKSSLTFSRGPWATAIAWATAMSYGRTSGSG